MSAKSNESMNSSVY